MKLIENKSDLSKLSTLGGSSIVIENQSEHLSKLTLYHLKKRATRRSRRAREPSRISLLFLRDLNKKNSMFGRNLSSKRFQRLQSSIAMLIRWENFIMHDKNVITNAIQRYDIMKYWKVRRLGKKSESQMGFEPTTLRDLVGCSDHWATGDSVVSKGRLDHGGSWVQIPSGTRIFFRVYVLPDSS